MNIANVLAQISNPVLDVPSGTSGSEFVNDLLPNLVAIGLLIGVTIFFFMFMIGALEWIFSGGNVDRVADARKRITNALVGLLVLLLIFVIVQVVNLLLNINVGNLGIGPGSYQLRCQLSPTGTGCVCNCASGYLPDVSNNCSTVDPAVCSDDNWCTCLRIQPTSAPVNTPTPTLTPSPTSTPSPICPPNGTDLVITDLERVLGFTNSFRARYCNIGCRPPGVMPFFQLRMRNILTGQISNGTVNYEVPSTGGCTWTTGIYDCVTFGACGDVTILATIDSSSIITETNESNNTYSEFIPGLPPPTATPTVVPSSNWDLCTSSTATTCDQFCSSIGQTCSNSCTTPYCSAVSGLAIGMPGYSCSTCSQVFVSGMCTFGGGVSVQCCCNPTGTGGTTIPVIPTPVPPTATPVPTNTPIPTRTPTPIPTRTPTPVPPTATPTPVVCSPTGGSCSVNTDCCGYPLSTCDLLRRICRSPLTCYQISPRVILNSATGVNCTTACNSCFGSSCVRVGLDPTFTNSTLLNRGYMDFSGLMCTPAGISCNFNMNIDPALLVCSGNLRNWTYCDCGMPPTPTPTPGCVDCFDGSQEWQCCGGEICGLYYPDCN